jgi:hypothetical protein
MTKDRNVTAPDTTLREYKYDVAFSFLGQDESLAREFSDALKPELSSFVFSERQKELAGKDGMEEFSLVFKEDSRLNVILFRDGWGTTDWTRVEEKAIQERVLIRDGWDTLLIMTLQEKPTPPRWFPKPLLYLSLPKFGFKEAIGAIRARAMEAGATSRTETPSELTARRRREVDDFERRTLVTNTKHGVEAATRIVADLFGLVKSEAKEIAVEAGESFPIQSAADQSTCVFRAGRISLSFAWSTQYLHSLKSAELCVTMFDGAIRMPGSSGQPSQRALQRQRATYELILAEGDVWLWREIDTTHTITSTALVAAWLRHVVTAAFAYLGESDVKVLKKRQSPS